MPDDTQASISAEIAAVAAGHAVRRQALGADQCQHRLPGRPEVLEEEQ